MEKIEIITSENKDNSSKTYISSKSVNSSSAEKRLKHPKEIPINEKLEYCTTINETDKTNEESTLKNTSDRVQFESVLKSSTYNAWRFAKRSKIFPLNSELQQPAGRDQNPYMFEDLMKDNPSICNVKTFELFEEITNKGEFIVQNYLGSGSYGVVLQVRSEDSGEVHAMKLYSSDPNDLRSYKERLTEMKVLQNLSHVNILPYYGFREYESHLGILLKFVDDGTLRDLMDARPISEELAANFTSQIVRGLNYLHSKDCIHRDIKPSNILITSIGVIKIADFGSSKFLNDRSTFNETHANTFKGTLMYIAPEVFQRCEYRKKCDIWSLGSVIFEMMTNKHICEENTRIDIYKWKRDMVNNLVLPDGLSELSKDLISKCLKINPEKRPSCDQLFQHNWFKEEESFEKWVRLQNLLEDDSDSKQDQTELAQEALKQEAKEAESFCDKVRKKRNPLVCGLITVLITVSVVILCANLTSRSTDEKKLMPLAPLHIEDHTKRIYEKPENLKKDENEEDEEFQNQKEGSKDNSNTTEPLNVISPQQKSSNLSKWDRLIYDTALLVAGTVAYILSLFSVQLVANSMTEIFVFSLLITSFWISVKSLTMFRTLPHFRQDLRILQGLSHMK